MSGTGATPARRVTAGYLAKALSAFVNESFNGLVTLTSVATSSSAVSPGALFAPGPGERDEASLRAAFDRGAYAFVLPEDEHGNPAVNSLGLPVLFAKNLEPSLGKVASYIEGDPSGTLAVFAIFGPDAQESAAKLAGLLHILGNSVALVSKAGSFSLDRAVSFKFPLDAVNLQRFEAVTLEEGAAALVIACDEETLAPYALVGTQIDVSADTGPSAGSLAAGPSLVPVPTAALPVSPRFGAVLTKQTHQVSPGMFADELSSLRRMMSAVPSVSSALGSVPARPAQGPVGPVGLSPAAARLIDPSMALSVSMALAAGITVGSIGQALQVSQEFS